MHAHTHCMHAHTPDVLHVGLPPGLPHLCRHPHAMHVHRMSPPPPPCIALPALLPPAPFPPKHMCACACLLGEGAHTHTCTHMHTHTHAHTHTEHTHTHTHTLHACRPDVLLVIPPAGLPHLCRHQCHTPSLPPTPRLTHRGACNQCIQQIGAGTAC